MNIEDAEQKGREVPEGAVPVQVEELGTFIVSKGLDGKNSLRIAVLEKEFLDLRPFGFWEKEATTKSLIRRAFSGLENGEIEAKTRATQAAFETHKEELRLLLYGGGGEEKREATPSEIPLEVREKALDLLRSPSFFYKLGLLHERGWVVPWVRSPRFVVGEDETKRLMPLLLAGVELGLVDIVQLRGDPATGKDSLIALAVTLLPFSVKRRGYFTPGAFRHGEGCTLLYLQDVGAMSGEMSRSLRFMRADDGGLEIEYAAKDPETGAWGTVTKKVEIRGVVTTTNAVSLDPALASGAWLLEADDNPGLGEVVKAEKLKLHAGDRVTVQEEELAVWRAALRLVLENPPQVRILWALQLLPLLSGKRTTTRRSPDKLCNLIKLVATFRRFAKGNPEVADLVDLFVALRLGRKALLESTGDIGARERVIVEKVKEKGRTTTSDIVNATKWSRTTCHDTLTDLVRKGILNKDKEGRDNVYSIINPDSETGENKLSLTFGESSKGPDWVIRTLTDLHFDLSNFQEGQVDEDGGAKICLSLTDPLTGEEVHADVPLRNVERSGREENQPPIVRKEESNLSAKGPERSKLVKSLKGGDFSILLELFPGDEATAKGKWALVREAWATAAYEGSRRAQRDLFLSVLKDKLTASEIANLEDALQLREIGDKLEASEEVLEVLR